MKKLFLLGAAIMFSITTVPLVYAATEATDAEALSLIMSVDQNEIQAAQNAFSRNVYPQVRDYADMLNQMHRASLEKTSRLFQDKGVAPVETSTVKQIKSDGASDLALLNSLQGEQYSKAYINSMVKGHTEALSLIDRLSPGVKDKDVQKHVNETRDRVASHLKRAKQIQSELEAQSK